MSQEAVAKSKEELLQTVSSLKQAVDAAGGKLGEQDKAIEELTAKYRELRTAADQAHTYVPSGTEAEAFGRYAMVPEIVKGQVADTANREEPIRYQADNKPDDRGRQYMAGKSGSMAVRMLTEWDEDGTPLPGLLDDPEPTTAWQLRLQELAEKRNLARMFCAKADGKGNVRFGTTTKIDRMIARHIQRGPEWVKQVFADNATEGAEFIPDIVLPDLGRRLELPRSCMALFATMPIPTGGTTRNPFHVRGCQPFIVGVPAAGDLDPADIARSVPTTADLTHTPVTWGVSLPASRDATEDSIIEWGSYGNMLLAEAIRDGEEDAAINADLNGQDTGLANWSIRSRWGTLGHTLDHRKSFVGLRADSFDSSSASALSTETAAGVEFELTNMDGPIFADEVVHVTSPEFWLIKLILDPNLQTVDKYGSLATLLTGEVGKIFGRRVLLSEFIDKEYNASGVYDHVTRTKTGVLSVAPKRWAKGVRRGPRVELETRPSQHITILTVTERWTLRKLGQSTEKSTVWQYNATAS